MLTRYFSIAFYVWSILSRRISVISKDTSNVEARKFNVGLSRPCLYVITSAGVYVFAFWPIHLVSSPFKASYYVNFKEIILLKCLKNGIVWVLKAYFYSSNCRVFKERW